MTSKPIFVTVPHLPPLEEFLPYLQEIWANKWLTNNGPMHQRLESELADFLGVPFVCLTNNATNGLMLALRALNISGEVLTTPYSFVATSHSIAWQGAVPVFIDIDPTTLNLDPRQIEASITPRTTAIMPVHCYGTPCDVDAIDGIAAKHGLKVIYDAAHAFGVKCHCGSVLNHGDLSVLSFHATKVFTTFEGGAIICQTAAMKQRIDLLKNFGIESETVTSDIGMNAKMAEINAAFGLLQLKSVEGAILARKQVAMQYLEGLDGVAGITPVQNVSATGLNYGYFPILVGRPYRLTRDELHAQLKENNLFARRYFYPLLSDFPMYSGLPSSQRQNLPVAVDAADRILCLPIFPGIGKESVARVLQLIQAGSA